MERGPYIYTMPEEFIKDSSVPPRWRIHALMNGYFINGLSFYASNQTISEKLNLSQWAISKGIRELEEMGKIRCERTRRGRICYSTGSVIFNNKGSANTLPPQCEGTISDSADALPNSDSNSDNNKDTDHWKLSGAKFAPAHLENEFESFWKEYPRKVAKQKCLRWWKQHRPTTEKFNEIVEALKLHKQSDQWTKENGSFIPHPYTWLNQGRWEDEVELKKKQSVGRY